MSYVVNSIVPLVFYGDKCQNLKSLKIIMMSWKEQRKRRNGLYVKRSAGSHLKEGSDEPKISTV